MFVKDLESLEEACVSVNNNLCWKLEPPTTFDKRFKVTWEPFFILDFNFCELENFTLKYYIESFYTGIIIKQN